jgi:hypothetical protein
MLHPGSTDGGSDPDLQLWQEPFREERMTTSTDQPLQRRDLLAALLLAAVLVVAATGRMYVGVCGQLHDDAIYVATARALAEGEGYRLINLPDAPVQTKYPFLYPALLAVLWTAWPVFPDNLVLLQGFSVLCGAGLSAAAYLYLVRFGYAARPAAFTSTLLCATSAYFTLFATVTMAEMFFGVLLLAALWRLETTLRAPTGARLGGLGLGVLLALPFLCRSIGIVLIPTALGVLAWRRRPVRWPSVGAALVVLPWLVWSLSGWMSSRHDPVQGYYTDYVGWFSALGVPILARVLAANGVFLVTGIVSLPLKGLAVQMEARHGGAFLLLFGTLGLVALARLVRQAVRAQALPVFLVGYLLLVWVWPWPPFRFLVPVLPLLFVFLLDALARLHWPAVASRRAALLAGMVGLVCLSANGWHLGQVCQRRHRLDTLRPEMPQPGSWASARALLAWIETHSRPDDVIAAGYDPMIYLYTGRRAYYPIVCPPLELFYQPTSQPTFEEGELLAGLNAHQPRFLALLPNHHGEERYRAWVEQLLRRYPEHVVLVYRGDDPRSAVYEVRYPLSGVRGQRAAEGIPAGTSPVARPCPLTPVGSGCP